MQISPDALQSLKPYVTKSLELVSTDADCEVLADYVLELLKSDGTEAQVCQNAKDQLAEFLDAGKKDGFVDGVFTELRKRSLIASSSTPASSGENGLNTTGIKRSYEETAHHNMDTNMNDVYNPVQSLQTSAYERPPKHARRGGRGGYNNNNNTTRGGFQGVQTYDPNQPLQPFPFSQQGQMPDFGFDPNNPMASLMAFQQAVGMQVPMPFSSMDGQNKTQSGKRCRDYDNKGICIRGASCPYDHINDIEPGDTGYAQNGHDSSSGRGRGRGRGGGYGQRGGRGGRADFSSAAPNHDRNLTSIVVENVPEENFSESAVTSFFSDFGQIESVTMQDQTRLAIVKYVDYEGARRAYDSPKVIFDNRFVKVYWYKPDEERRSSTRGRGGKYNGLERPDNGGEDVDMTNEDETLTTPTFDPEAFAAQQAIAQQRFEAQKAARAEREELEAKVTAQAEERAQLLAKLAQKTSQSNVDSPSSQTDALRAKLAALEAEARSIGLNPDSPTTSEYPSSRGGSFRGRGRGRGRGFSAGSYSPYPTRGGRGAWRGSSRGTTGAVKRLDNRPRALVVTFDDGSLFDESKDEALKQYLLFVRPSPSPFL